MADVCPGQIPSASPTREANAALIKFEFSSWVLVVGSGWGRLTSRFSKVARLIEHYAALKRLDDATNCVRAG
jgi:hypothetical protein